MDAVVVPSTLALLEEYASIDDPIGELREACRSAVAWLAQRHPTGVAVIGSALQLDDRRRGVLEPPGRRIGRSLLRTAGVTEVPLTEASGVIAVGNGSATRSERAPGFLDPRADAFDRHLLDALHNGDSGALRTIDRRLAVDLWCVDVDVFAALADLFPRGAQSVTFYADDPFGVQYWVGAWTSASRH